MNTTGPSDPYLDRFDWKLFNNTQHDLYICTMWCAQAVHTRVKYYLVCMPFLSTFNYGTNLTLYSWRVDIKSFPLMYIPWGFMHLSVHACHVNTAILAILTWHAGTDKCIKPHGIYINGKLLMSTLQLYKVKLVP